MHQSAVWNANHEVHDLKVEGPYVHGDQFVVRFKLDVTPKGEKRIHLDEVGLYTGPEPELGCSMNVCD